MMDDDCTPGEENAMWSRVQEEHTGPDVRIKLGLIWLSLNVLRAHACPTPQQDSALPT